MKIPPIGNRITRFFETKKLNREQKLIDNFVKIHNDQPHNDAFVQIDKAKKTIANYALAKGVSVDIYSAEAMLGEHDSPLFEERLHNKLMLKVTDMLTGKNESRFLNARTDITYPHIENDYFVIDYPQDDIQRTRLTKHEYEDNFLKYLYRNIESMVNNIQGKK